MATLAVNTIASGLDIFLRFQGVLTDPTSITYQITEPASTVVGSGSGFKRSTGHYDARNSTIPSGFSIASAWTITWTFTSPAGVTSTASEDFSVSTSLVASFDNIQDVKDQVKLDLGLTTEFTDAQLTTFVVKAINRLNRRLELTGTSSELSFDTGTGTISPSPNSTMQDFLVMQTECLLMKRDRRVAIGKGIRVKDGETEIDTTASFAGWNDSVEDICGELDEAVEKFLDDEDKTVYQTAFNDAKNIWYGNTNICEDLLHNGQGDGRTRCEVSPFEEGNNGLTVSM